MRLLITLFITMMSSCLLSQVDNFDISTFKTPDYKFQTLRFDPYFHHNSDGNGSEKILNIGLNSDYYLEKNTRKRISILRGSLVYSYNKIQKQDDPILSYGSIPSLNITSQNQLFFDPKRFLELSGSSDAIWSGFTGINNYIINFAFSPKLGFGRIENVTNAWHTQSILKALKKEGLLLKELSHEEITSIAKKMTSIKNKRVIDFRMEDIYEYESIIAYLVDNEIADPKNYKFFSIFQDAWRFEAYRIRRQGSTLTIGPSSNFRIHKDFKTHSHGLEAKYSTNFNKMNWYYGYGLGITIGREYPESVSAHTFDIITAHIIIGNYLNSRTYAEVAANYRISDSYRLGELVINGRFEYFISPRLKFLGTLDYTTNHIGLQDVNQLQVGFGANYILI